MKGDFVKHHPCCWEMLWSAVSWKIGSKKQKWQFPRFRSLANGRHPVFRCDVAWCFQRRKHRRWPWSLGLSKSCIFFSKKATKKKEFGPPSEPTENATQDDSPKRMLFSQMMQCCAKRTAKWLFENIKKFDLGPLESNIWLLDLCPTLWPEPWIHTDMWNLEIASEKHWKINDDCRLVLAENLWTQTWLIMAS